MAAEDAPVGMPSLDISIDMGASVSGAEADELPVEIDDLDMIEDDVVDAAPVSSLPAAAVVAVTGDDDELPSDPTAMLEALLLRVRNNRRAA